MDFFLCSDPALGSATQIVTAGAAVVAASTGIYGVRNAVRTYRASVDDQERQAQSDRRDQARFVHPMVGNKCWIAEENEPFYFSSSELVVAPEVAGRSLDHRDEEIVVFSQQALVTTETVQNDSREVISDVSISLEDEHGDRVPEMVSASLRYLLPETAKTFSLAFPWASPSVPTIADWSAWVVFTDARDNIWTRRTRQPVRDFSNSH